MDLRSIDRELEFGAASERSSWSTWAYLPPGRRHTNVRSVRRILGHRAGARSGWQMMMSGGDGRFASKHVMSGEVRDGHVRRDFPIWDWLELAALYTVCSAILAIATTRCVQQVDVLSSLPIGIGSSFHVHLHTASSSSR